MSSWHLPTFLNPEGSMSYSTEHDSECAESSHQSTGYHSDPNDTKLEEAFTASDDNIFTSIQYSSSPPVKNFPLYFPKPYLHTWDFKDSDQALRYITKFFNHETIHQSLKSFPDLSINFIYSNTYMESHCFTQLQHYINKSICDWDAKQLEL